MAIAAAVRASRLVEFYQDINAAMQHAGDRRDQADDAYDEAGSDYWFMVDVALCILKEDQGY
jgi:hypothetical protein